MDLSPMYRCPDGNIVQFYEMPVPHGPLSEKEGRAVNWKALMAIFRSPAMKNQVHHQEIELFDESGKSVRKKLSMTNRDKTRLFWADILKDQLAAYRDGKEGDAIGTPLSNYPKIDVAIAATLKAAGVHTLEALAAVPDAQLGSLGPQSRVLREGAVNFLAAMTGNSELKAQKAEMEKQLAEMRAQIAELTAAAAPKRGRPAKAAQAA